MADFQLLSCRIMLAGSKDSVVYRGAHNPLSYPEVLIMQFMHGDDAVDEIEEVGTLAMSNNDLVHHLRLTYPQEAVAQSFPGARPNLPVRSDEFPKSRAVLMDAQASRETRDAEDAKREARRQEAHALRHPETPGPAPSTENMKVPEPQPETETARRRHARQQHKDADDAGPFAE
jgi:hypothetical protein